MKSRRVAVIGGGIGGMTAAGLLAKRGCDVVLFEQSDTLGGKAQTITVNGHRYDTGPTLMALPHYVQRVFEELDAELPRLHRLTHQCHYRYADGRQFDVYDDLDATLASAEALAPGEGARLKQFYEEAEKTYELVGKPFLEAPFDSLTGFARALLPHGMRSAWFGLRMGTLDAMAARLVRSPELRQFIGRFATYVGGSPYRASASYALIPHIEHRYGIHHPEGGMGAVAAALGRAITRAGVDVRLGVRAEAARDSSGFQVAGERFDRVVVNADPTAAGTTELSLSAYVALLRVPRGGPGWRHHTILFAKDARREFDALFSGALPDDTTIYVCNAAATDPSMVGYDGSLPLYAMINVPPTAGQFPVERVRERLIAAVDPRAELVAERTPQDFARTGSPHGALYGAVGHGRLGPFRRPKMRSGVPGKFHVGGGTHPGGGVPMVCLSGRFAADLVLKDLG